MGSWGYFILLIGAGTMSLHFYNDRFWAHLVNVLSILVYFGYHHFLSTHQKYTNISVSYRQLGGGFKYFLFSPLPGEMIQFD